MKKKNFGRNIIIFVLLIALTFYFVFKDQDIGNMLNVFAESKKEFIAIGIVSMFFYLCLEAVNMGRTLKALGEKSNFIKNLKYAFIGFFFSAITPAASGGQPMQIYYMHKDKISVANSTLALLINLMCMQIVTISIALISVGFNHNVLDGGLIAFFVIGILLNMTALSLLLIGIFSTRILNWLINIAEKVLKFFKVKNVESKKEKLQLEVEKYKESAKYVKANKKVMFKTLLTAYVQFLMYYGITYWVYLALGLKGENALNIIALQSLVYGTVSGIPSPGAVGVSEGAFMAIFKSVIPEAMLGSAMILNRGINFYLYVIISAIVVLKAMLLDKKDGKNIEDEAVNENAEES